MTAAGCTEFVERLEDLALGNVDEPERALLLAHAASCATCAARLSSMVELTDRLLLLAPSHDPAAGFESRVLARLDASSTPARSSRLWSTAKWIGVAAVFAILLAGLTYALARDEGSSNEVASAVILRRDGTRSGEVHLVDGANPYVLVVVDQPRPGNGQVYCELVLADGQSARVGSWDFEDVEAHVWAVGIDRQWLDSVQMNVVLEDGTVVGTAELT